MTATVISESNLAVGKHVSGWVSDEAFKVLPQAALNWFWKPFGTSVKRCTDRNVAKDEKAGIEKAKPEVESMIATGS